MELVRTFLMISCLCFNSFAGSFQPNSSGQPPLAPSARVESNEQTSRKVTDRSVLTDQLHTPPRGSAERQALMDALREEYRTRRDNAGRPYQGNITFVVIYLKVHNGWAWTYAEPHSSDPNDEFGENSGFLLHQQGRRWGVMNLPPMVDDPDDPENLDYPTRRDVERIRRMYPSVPTDIFPRQQ